MSNDLLVLEKGIIKTQKPTFMIAGFNQWANAGNVSTGIPEYLIEKLHARRVGHIRKDDFYIFQVPGSHFMFGTPVKYVNGYEEDYQGEPINDFHYAEIDEKGLIIFIGTEPNQREDVYVNTLLDGAEELGIKRIIVPAGVGGEVPFDKERRINCTYSMKQMQEELKKYAVNLLNFSMNATIGMAINHYSKVRGIESIRMSARTPSYQVQLTFHSDKRAMYDILRRIRYMFGIKLDLSDLEKESRQQLTDFENTLKVLFQNNPALKPQVTTYMKQIAERFEELKFEEPIKIPDVFLKEFNELI
jgi:predicted ATP-grasp superfamily ATP-dependent carboligase